MCPKLPCIAIHISNHALGKILCPCNGYTHTSPQLSEVDFSNSSTIACSPLDLFHSAIAEVPADDVTFFCIKASVANCSPFPIHFHFHPSNPWNSSSSQSISLYGDVNMCDLQQLHTIITEFQLHFGNH